MKEIQLDGLVELNHQEMKETNGGIPILWLVLGLAALVGFGFGLSDSR